MRMRPSFANCSSAVALVALGFLAGCGRRAALGPAGSSGELPTPR